jgi:ABC-type nitrate/sulfonate/bicarbonate transport system substrate-binding protein
MLSKPLTRRNVLTTASALLGVAALPSFSFAGETVAVRNAFDWIPSEQYAGFYKAMEDGGFLAKNLNVSSSSGGPNSPPPFVLLAGGQADIGFGTWLSLLDAVGKGNDFVVIGASFPQSPGGILSLPSKPVRTPADINGKRMMIQDPSLSVIFDGMLAFAGIKPDYEVVSVGFSAEPLLAGDGDGYLCFVTNQPLALEAMGLVKDKDFVLATFHELGYDIPETLMVVPRSFIEQHRGALVDYLEALLRGWKAHDADPQQMMHYIVEKFGVDFGYEFDVEMQKNAIQTPLTFAPGGGGRFDITDEQITRMYELASLTKRTPPKASSIIDLSMLREAAARL